MLEAGSFRGERIIYGDRDRCPLIIDTGESVTLTPFRGYFTNNDKCKVKIQGLAYEKMVTVSRKVCWRLKYDFGK